MFKYHFKCESLKKTLPDLWNSSWYSLGGPRKLSCPSQHSLKFLTAICVAILLMTVSSSEQKFREGRDRVRLGHCSVYCLAQAWQVGVLAVLFEVLPVLLGQGELHSNECRQRICDNKYPAAPTHRTWRYVSLSRLKYRCHISNHNC